MKAESMFCAPSAAKAARRNWTRGSLLDRPTEHGFGTELWTLKRIRLLIKRMFGVSFSEVHAWRIIGALGFSNQKPDRRAKN